MNVIRATKKPVTVSCVLWDGTMESLQLCLIFMNTNIDMFTDMDAFLEHSVRNGLRIETLEGVMTASVGDYIIQGVNREFYPCKPDIFHKTYDINK